MDQQPVADPHRVLKSFAALKSLTAMYPVGHPLVADAVTDICTAVRNFGATGWIWLDVIHGVVHVDGVASDGPLAPSGLGFDSLCLHADVTPDEIAAAAGRLPASGVERVSVGRLVPLDTRWRARRWADQPEQVYDPNYEESLALARQAFEDLSHGRRLDLRSVRDLVQLLIGRVVSSHAAVAQILAVKRFENLTYIHSVNVAVLSLLIGRKIGLSDPQLAALVEAAVLHDVGKTRIPLDLVKKPGALDRRERKIMESHPVVGAELLAQLDGLHPLTPVIALEHHRTAVGGGYPDLGDGLVPHFMSQIVSVADIYEAVTGARSYQDPTPPERACLLLARLAGSKLNAALVKAFVNAITFFPIGSLVRTDRGELAAVIRVNDDDPLHPIVRFVSDRLAPIGDAIDTRTRDRAGNYHRHLVETVQPPDDGAVVAQLFAAA